MRMRRSSLPNILCQSPENANPIANARFGSRVLAQAWIWSRALVLHVCSPVRPKFELRTTLNHVLLLCSYSRKDRLCSWSVVQTGLFILGHLRTRRGQVFFSRYLPTFFMCLQNASNVLEIVWKSARARVPFSKKH